MGGGGGVIGHSVLNVSKHPAGINPASSLFYTGLDVRPTAGGCGL